MSLKILNLDSKRRDAIINSALTEFAAKGYDDASTNVIAREAGISKGLLFHYINTKKELFLFLYDYCNQVLKEEYFALINYKERDILERFRQTYLLKIDVIQKYPQIFEFVYVFHLTESDDVKEEVEKTRKNEEKSGFDLMFEDIDQSKFRDGLDVEKCKELIYWSILGYSDQHLNKLKNTDLTNLDFEKIRIDFDSYLDQLRKSFYKDNL